MQQKDETIKLLRELLGSIDIPDLEDKEESEEEHRAYCAAIFAVFPRLEKDLKRFMHRQLMFSSQEAGNWDQVIFGRGSFNGMALLLDHWQQAQAEHIANGKEKEVDE